MEKMTIRDQVREMVQDAINIDMEAHYMSEAYPGFISDTHKTNCESYKKRVIAFRKDIIEILNDYNDLVKQYEYRLTKPKLRKK